MTDERFSELVNLYLDKEIDRRDLAELRAEVDSEPARRRDFEERRRLHRAMKLALRPAGRERARGRAVPARRRRGGRPSAPRTPLLALSGAMAAALALGVVLFNPVLREILNDGVEPEAQVRAGVYETGIETFDADRYASGRDAGARPSAAASLTAQLRLAGLGPETSPVAAEVRWVEPSALEARAERASLPGVPEQTSSGWSDDLRPFTLERFEARAAAPGQGFWPEGFESSLAGY